MGTWGHRNCPGPWELASAGICQEPRSHPGSWQLASTRVSWQPGFAGIYWEPTGVTWECEFARAHQEPLKSEGTGVNRGPGFTGAQWEPGAKDTTLGHSSCQGLLKPACTRGRWEPGFPEGCWILQVLGETNRLTMKKNSLSPRTFM